MTVEQQTLQWLAGEWIDDDRSYYEVQIDSDFSCSVKTIRADGGMIFTKGLIQIHGKDIYWKSYRLEYVESDADCIKWISTRLKSKFCWRRSGIRVNRFENVRGDVDARQEEFLLRISQEEYWQEFLRKIEVFSKEEAEKEQRWKEYYQRRSRFIGL